MPVVVEFILERVTNIAMGTEIDNIVEFEEVLDLPLDDTPVAADAREPGMLLAGANKRETDRAEIRRQSHHAVRRACRSSTASPRAKAAGFSGVEYLFPYDFDKAELREQLDQHGLTQVLHNLPAGNWAAGERGIAILPDRVDEFRDGVARAIDYAKALDCRQLNCLVGIAPAGADPSRAERGAGRQSALRRG